MQDDDDDVVFEGEYPELDDETLCRLADELFLELDEREAEHSDDNLHPSDNAQ